MRRRLLAHRDQPGQAGPPWAANSPTSSWLAREESPSSAMWPEDRERAPVPRQVPQRVDGGPNGLGVRVVGIVNDRHSIRPLADLHPPPAARDRGGKPVRDPVEARPSSRASAAAASAFGTLCAPCSRRVTGAEPSGVSSVKLGRPRSSSRTSAARDAGTCRWEDRSVDAEGHDAGRGAGGHGQDAGVVGVQDRAAPSAGGSASASSPLARATWSRPPNSPACACPTFSTTP